MSPRGFDPDPSTRWVQKRCGRALPSLGGLVLVLLLLIDVPGLAGAAQSVKPEIVGTWVARLVNPGLRTGPLEYLIFTADGRFANIILRPGRRAGDNGSARGGERNTPELAGSLVLLGTYQLSDATHMLTQKILGGTMPQWRGSIRAQVFAIRGDELRVTNPSRTGATVFERLK